MYSNLTSPSTGFKSGKTTNDVRKGELIRHTKKFSLLLRSPLDENCKTGMYMLISFLLDRVINCLGWCGCLEVLDASPFERLFCK